MPSTPGSSTASAGNRRRAVVVAAVVLTAVLAIPTLGVAQPTPALPADPALIISLDDDGDAIVTLVVPFDLTTDADRDAFEALRANDTAQAERAARFADRIRAIADRTEANVDRDMAVSQRPVVVTERGDTGLVALSVDWSGLATTDGDSVVVAEPFASGFAADRMVVLRAPAGYEIVGATPTPDAITDSSATWTAGTDLAGFRVQVAPDGGATATDGQPGFGALVAAVAVVAVAGLARLRLRRPE